MRQTPRKSIQAKKSQARSAVTSRVATPSSPGWVSGSEVQFKTPCTVSPPTRRVTRRTSIYQSLDKDGFGQFKVPTSSAFIVSPPGVKTRARRSSMYQAGGINARGINLLDATKKDNSVFIFSAKPETAKSKAIGQKAKPSAGGRRKSVIKSSPVQRTTRTRAKVRIETEANFSKVYNTPKEVLPNVSLSKEKKGCRPTKTPNTRSHKSLINEEMSDQTSGKLLPPGVISPERMTVKSQKRSAVKTVSTSQVLVTKEEKSQSPLKRHNKDEITESKVVDSTMMASVLKSANSPKSSTPNLAFKHNRSVYNTPSDKSPVLKKVTILRRKSTYSTPNDSLLKLKALKRVSSAGRTPRLKRRRSGDVIENPVAKRTKPSNSPLDRRIVKAARQTIGKTLTPKMFHLEQLSPVEMSSILKSVSSGGKKRKAVDSPAPEPSKLAKLATQEVEVHSTPRVYKPIRRTTVKLADITLENENKNSHFDSNAEDTAASEASLWDMTINTDSRSSRCVIL